MAGAASERSWWYDWLTRCRESRQLVLVIVAIALVLDNMLLTTVGKSVPTIYMSIYNNYDSIVYVIPTSFHECATVELSTALNINKDFTNFKVNFKTF